MSSNLIGMLAFILYSYRYLKSLHIWQLLVSTMSQTISQIFSSTQSRVYCLKRLMHIDSGEVTHENDSGIDKHAEVAG